MAHQIARSDTGDGSLLGLLKGRLGVVLALMFVATFVSFGLPDIPLDSALADWVVYLTDTATWPELAVVCVAAVVLFLTQSHGPAWRRIAAFAVVILIALLASGSFNERIVKPLFAIHRPNIVTLAEAGALGPDISDASEFYASGGTAARRQLLHESLAEAEHLGLSPLVADHWAYESGYGFPSGHTVAAFELATVLVGLGLVWLRGWRRAIATWGAPIWAVAISYSRPLLEVHAPLDVIAGAFLGIAWGIAALVAIRRLSIAPRTG